MVCHVVKKIMIEATIHQESKFPIRVQNRMIYDNRQNPCRMQASFGNQLNSGVSAFSRLYLMIAMKTVARLEV